MRRKVHSTPPPLRVEALISEGLSVLERLGFRPTTRRYHRGVWRGLLRFAKKKGFRPVMSGDLVAAYLASRGIRQGEPSTKRTGNLRHFLGSVRKLMAFAQHGSFQFHQPKCQRPALRASFEQPLEAYSSFAKDELGMRSTTLRSKERYLRTFLNFLEATGVEELGQAQPAILSDFLASRSHLRPVTLADLASHLRGFLRFLFMRGLLAEDLSVHVLRIRTWRQDRLPSVWKPEEVEAMVAVIDRNSPVGKRNYSIVLLACRLGLRVGDIRNLRLEDLRWDEARIVIRQSKTGEPEVLPLSNEVGEALIDYLKHGRPESDHRQVFLTVHAPFVPFSDNNNLHNILTKCRRLAGIKVPCEGHWGLHSLRHTLATRLLQQGTPLPLISEILGHRSTESTLIYTKVDLDALRSVPLDPEEVLDA